MSHTQVYSASHHCLLQALQGVQKGQQALQSASLVALLTLTSQLGRGAEPLSSATVSTTLAGVVCIAAIRLLKVLEKKLTYEDYDHAHS